MCASSWSMGQPMTTVAEPRSLPVAPATSPPPAASAGRLVGLDAFRGITVAAMVLVNNPGDWNARYAALEHADWNGWGPTEVIAPAFLWIVGVAAAFSIGRRRERGEAERAIVVRIVRRSVLLLLIGLALAAIPRFLPLLDVGSLHTLRVPGTLQRIAVCYLVAALALLRVDSRGRILLAAAFIAGYWALMLLVPVPGHGAGDLGRDGNLAQYIDHLVLGSHAKWSDPLGLLSTLPAIGTTLLGTAAGSMLRRDLGSLAAVRTLLLSGVVLLLIGAALAVWIPVNESLWSPSFAIRMPGLASVACAACIWACDVRGRRGWSRPFEIYGSNALVIFVASQAFASLITAGGFAAQGRSYISLKGYLFNALFRPLGSPEFASMCYALAVVAAFYLMALVLYRQRWFVTV